MGAIQRAGLCVQGAVALLLACAALAAGGLPSDADAAVQSVCAAQGSGAGECSDPRGVATDFETGRLYVAERGNDRISVFEADGDFVMAFGWDVDPSGGTGPETCTTASGCKAGSEGSGAGQLNNPTQIAVDNILGSPTRHHLYVVGSDFRWSHFEADGTFVGATGWDVMPGGGTDLETCTTASTCQVGVEGGGECQLDDADVGNVGPIAIGPAGNVFLADTAGNEPNFTDRVEKFSAAGACLGETVLVEGHVILSGLAIDSSEDAYVSVNGEGRELRKYDLAAPKTKLCDLDPGIGTTVLTIDGADRLYASQLESRAAAAGTHRVIAEYDGPACKVLHRFAYGQVQTNIPAGIAVLHGPMGGGPEGDVWVSEGAGGVHYLDQPPMGPNVAPESVEATGIGNAKATIKAEANPEGKVTEVRVEYVTDAEFDTEGGFEAPGKKTTDPVAFTLPPEERLRFRVQASEFQLGCPVASKEEIENGSCLTPDTEYHFRVRAVNADNLEGAGVATVTGTFKTKEPLEIEDFWASEVGTDAARLSTVVNPLGIPATGRFEYVTDAQFKASGFAEAVKAPSEAEAEIDFGSGEVGVKRSLVLSPLASGTTYHYRLAARNALIEGFRLSEVKTFRTYEEEKEEEDCPGNEEFRSGASATLPDCRAYELVSPLDKANGDIIVLEQLPSLQPGVLSQSAVSGERLTYGSYRAFGDAKSAPFTSQYLAERNPLGHPEEGWQSRGISPLQSESIKGSAEFDFEFRAFSEELCEGWITPLFEPVLAPGGVAGVRNLYRGTDLCEGEEYEAISTAAPEHPEKTPEYIPELQGLSQDGTVAAFAGNDNLVGTEAPPIPNATSQQLYLKGPGQGPRYVCILPGGAPALECSAGMGTSFGLGQMREANVTGALSADGKRVFWTDSGDGEGEIYLRQNPLAEGAECVEETSPCTIPVSEAGEEDSGSTDSHFWAGAKDGSAAIFSTGALGKEDLYRFEVEAEATEKIAGGALGILGQSEDLSRVYFASTEVLSGEEENSEGAKAQAGKANLYLYEAGPGPASFTFIGVLAPEDASRSAEGKVESSALATEPAHHNGRVSADGLHAAFMARAPLTGYDNTDAASGEPDTEVFLYDAAAGEILCASCNPSGGRPAGVDIASVGNPFGGANPFWIAARLPVYSTTLHAPEVLAEDGSRLIFESQDPLIPRDTNSRLDVYEWERLGTGGCKEELASFSAKAGGCIEPISSGKSKRNSEIVDASAGGEDVFFSTLSSLVPQDYGLIDIYDARVGGGFPSPPPPAPVCEGETCQSPAPAPEAQTPVTEVAVGPGNLPPQAKKPKCPKGKHRVTSKAGKSRCVPNKKDGKGKRRNGGAGR